MTPPYSSGRPDSIRSKRAAPFFPISCTESSAATGTANCKSSLSPMANIRAFSATSSRSMAFKIGWPSPTSTNRSPESVTPDLILSSCHPASNRAVSPKWSAPSTAPCRSSTIRAGSTTRSSISTSPRIPATVSFSTTTMPTPSLGPSIRRWLSTASPKISGMRKSPVSCRTRATLSRTKNARRRTSKSTSKCSSAP